MTALVCVCVCVIQVILMAHHPIGGADSIVRLSRWYQSLVIEYSDIIVLQPTGHTHTDEIRMVRSMFTISASVCSSHLFHGQDIENSVISGYKLVSTLHPIQVCTGAPTVDQRFNLILARDR